MTSTREKNISNAEKEKKMDIDKLYKMITDLEEENSDLRKRCYKLSKGKGCDFCSYECDYRPGGLKDEQESKIIANTEENIVTIKCEDEQEMKNLLTILLQSLKKQAENTDGELEDLLMAINKKDTID